MAEVYDKILVKGAERFRKNNKFTGADSVPEATKEVLTFDNMVDENGLIIVDKKGEEPSDEAPAEAPAADTPATTDPDEDGESTDDDVNDDPLPTEAEQNPDAPADEEVDETEKESPADVPAPPAPTTDPDEDGEEEEPAQPSVAQVNKSKTKATVPQFVSKVPQSVKGMGFPRKNGKTVDIFDGETPHTHIKLVGGYTVPLSDKSFNDCTEKEIEDRLRELGYEVIDFSGRQNADEEGFDENLSSEDDLTDDTV